MSTIYNIKNIDDIKVIQNAILNNEEFKIGVIEPLEYEIKLDGGRFTNYDVSVIDATIAKLILSQQNNYSKLLNELEKQFGIKFSDEDKILKFKLQNGSLKILSKIFELKAIKNMKSKHIVYIILGTACMWFTSESFTEYNNTRIKELEIKDKEQNNIVVQEAIKALKELALNQNIQNAVNKPKQDIIKSLNDGEKLILQNHELTKNDENKYNYTEPTIEDIEEIKTENFIIEYYNFIKDGKPFKLRGIKVLANSETLDVDKRIQLIQKADNRDEIKLKVKIIRNGNTNEIKKVYILDLI